MLAPLPAGMETAIYVTASRDKEDIVRALHAAGFRLVGQPAETPYLLRVTIGVEQSAQACGTLRNVRYDLRAEGRTVLDAEAKGWTGKCEPNVFDVVSRAIRERIGEAGRQEKP